jgi:hypothetical protein
VEKLDALGAFALMRKNDAHQSHAGTYRRGAKKCNVYDKLLRKKN